MLHPEVLDQCLESGVLHFRCYRSLMNDQKAKEKHCPLRAMPKWIAYLLELVDFSSSEKRPDFVRRLAALARSGTLSRVPYYLEIEFKVECVRIALKSLTEDRWGVSHACLKVIESLESDGLSGEAFLLATRAAEASVVDSSSANSAAKAAATAAASDAPDGALNTAWHVAGVASESPEKRQNLVDLLASMMLSKLEEVA